MSRVPWWAVVSAALAPVFLIGSWTVAADLQPAGYSSSRDTISALAGLAATDREVMTAGFVGLGVCHLVTAWGLRPARPTGRLMLAVGGLATILVAAFPLPLVGPSQAHRLVAGLALVTLGLWPVFARRDGPAAPWGLRPYVSLTAAAGFLILLGLLAAQLPGDGGLTGLTERLVAGAEAVWPLVVVVTVRLADRAP
jgi:hypothetical membrane protein